MSADHEACSPENDSITDLSSQTGNVFCQQSCRLVMLVRLLFFYPWPCFWIYYLVVFMNIIQMVMLALLLRFLRQTLYRFGTKRLCCCYMFETSVVKYLHHLSSVYSVSFLFWLCIYAISFYVQVSVLDIILISSAMYRYSGHWFLFTWIPLL